MTFKNQAKEFMQEIKQEFIDKALGDKESIQPLLLKLESKM